LHGCEAKAGIHERVVLGYNAGSFAGWALH